MPWPRRHVPVSDLAGALHLSASDDGSTVGQCMAGRSGRIFGGQLLAQSLMAAAPKPATDLNAHSVVGHFLRAGVPTEPVHYHRLALHRSQHFETTRVDAEQGKGLTATVTISSHDARETATHEPRPPVTVGTPDDMPAATGGPIPPPDAPIRRAFDLREGRLWRGVGDDGRPRIALWVRLRTGLDGRLANDAALLWLSDFALTRVADLEHETSPGIRKAASLNHAMWLHRQTDLTQWHLYVVSSPIYRSGLALSCGQIFRRDGDLIASVTQQSLLRRKAEATINQPIEW